MKNGFRNSNGLHDGFNTLACITKLHVRMLHITPDTAHNKHTAGMSNHMLETLKYSNF